MKDRRAMAIQVFWFFIVAMIISGLLSLLFLTEGMAKPIALFALPFVTGGLAYGLTFFGEHRYERSERSE